MKALKTFIIVLIAVCSFIGADAQIRVRIGGHPHYRRHWHRPPPRYYHRHWHRY